MNCFITYCMSFRVRKQNSQIKVDATLLNLQWMPLEEIQERVVRPKRKKIISCCQRWGRLCRRGWSESTRGWSLRRRRRSGGSRSPGLEERGPGKIIRIQVQYWIILKDFLLEQTHCLDFNINILISATASTTTQTSNICALATSEWAISS